MAEAIIALFKSCDAFTLMQKEGARWIDELLRDAADAAAPPGLKADASAVRRYVGAAEGARPTRRQTDMFIQRFEAYLLENTVPSAELARVFAQLRSWLATIYVHVDKSRGPITDDIRDWYVRVLSVDRGTPVIVPERARPSSHFLGPPPPPPT